MLSIYTKNFCCIVMTRETERASIPLSSITEAGEVITRNNDVRLREEEEEGEILPEQPRGRSDRLTEGNRYREGREAGLGGNGSHGME